MSYFAESLKNLRQQSGLSMQTLADNAEVSKSMISKIERDEVQPTLDVAGRLAKALGKPLSEMLHPPQTVQATLLAKNDQAVWEDASGIKRRNISPVFEGLEIEWLQVELPIGAGIEKGKSVGTHAIEKYILVTKGLLEIKIAEEVFRLKKGDSLYFDANVAHEFFNRGKEVVEYYLVMRHK